MNNNNIDEIVVEELAEEEFVNDSKQLKGKVTHIENNLFIVLNLLIVHIFRCSNFMSKSLKSAITRINCNFRTIRRILTQRFTRYSYSAHLCRASGSKLDPYLAHR